MKRIVLSPRSFAGVVITAALFLPLAVFGGSALARSTSSASQYQYSGSSQYQYRVQVCHKTHSKKHPWRTITVSNRALKGHLRHGDTLGACVGNPPAPPKTHGKSGEQHGKSGEQHGKK
jgi:hypothetical protein